MLTLEGITAGYVEGIDILQNLSFEIRAGVITGMIGTVLGLVAGYLLAFGLGHYHWIYLSPEVYSIDYVPSAPRLVDGIVVAVVAVGISFVATLYPSYSASRVLPAESLRYE